MSATYKIVGTRYLRKYTSAVLTPSYAVASDARMFAESLPSLPWERAKDAGSAIMTTHDEKSLDMNTTNRELIDAASWCAEHANGMHRAYGQASCYKFRLPESLVGASMESISAIVTSDPYNLHGARIAVLTNSTGTIPTDCPTCRTGAAYAHHVAQRSVSGEGTATRWHATTETCTLTPESPLTLGTHLYLFVLLEEPSYYRDGWLEGSSFIAPTLTITLTQQAEGFTEGDTINCSEEEDGIVVITGFSDTPVSKHLTSGITSIAGTRAVNVGSLFVFIFCGNADCPFLEMPFGVYSDSTRSGYQLKTTTDSTNIDLYEHLTSDETNAIITGKATGFFLLAPTSKTSGSTTYITPGVICVATEARTKIYGMTLTGSPVQFYPYKCVRGNTDYEEIVSRYETAQGFKEPCATKLFTYNSSGHTVFLPVSLGDSQLEIGGYATLKFDGVATGVGDYITNNSGRFILSGDFKSVGGVPVKHCALIDCRGRVPYVQPLPFDDIIAPNAIDRFTTWYLTPSGNVGYRFSGAFTRLGGVPCEYGSAMIGNDDPTEVFPEAETVLEYAAIPDGIEFKVTANSIIVR